jgi:hypothetical protein
MCVACRVGENGNVTKCAARSVVFFWLELAVLESRRLVAYNDLLIGDGRDTEALNCKPNTNL